MNDRGILKDDRMDLLAMRLAEGFIEELDGENRQKTIKEEAGKTMSTKGLQFHVGIMLCLTGAILASARGTTAIIVMAGVLFLLEVIETATIPDRKKPLIYVVLSGAILLISILQMVETVGKNFNMNVFYLLVILLGALLMMIEAIMGAFAKSAGK